MNASDIIKERQNQTLYKAYYDPTIFPGVSNGVSTLVRSTINYYPISSSGATISYASTISINYMYECEPAFTSYQLVNAVNNGQYICGGKKISELSWEANSTMGTQTIYTSSNQILSTSVNSYAVRPMIFTNPVFYQGNNFISGCPECDGCDGCDCCDECIGCDDC